MKLVPAILAYIAVLGSSAAAQREIPKTWDERALSEWATPLAGLNVRPGHISASDYYALRVENLRTYPVYYPGREPEGYWDMIQRVGPKPLIAPDKLKTKAAWVEAGRRVFDEADHLHVRTLDPKFIAAARSQETFAGGDAEPLPDGTVFGMRWVPTARGVALSFSNCSNCHLLYLRDGTRIPGAPSLAGVSRGQPRFRVPLLRVVFQANHVISTAAPFRVPDESLGISLYRRYGVPWLKEDPNERLKGMQASDVGPFVDAGLLGGALSRWNGSLFYPAKIPDLIGFKDRKYIDATGTHVHRGAGDLMRYAASVSFAETADFGPHHVLSTDMQRPGVRLSDEALYALALYIYSLQPPRNPNPLDENAKAGQKIFARERCIGCHTPPLYTNNKLTLAEGFTPPKDKPSNLDVMAISVGTDPGLALKTRKGTGYYKVRRLVSRPLLARWIGGKLGRDVRPGPPQRHARAWGLESAGYQDSCHQRP